MNYPKLKFCMFHNLVPVEKLSNLESVYQRVKLSDLNKKYADFLEWKSFLNIFFVMYDSDARLNDDDSVIVLGLEYFESLSSLIRTYKSDPEKENVLKMYALMHLIRYCLPLLSKEYRTQVTTLGETITGTNTVERWQTCIEHTDNIYGLGYAIARMFIRRVPNNSKMEAEKMIKSIKRSFINHFPKIPWMDDETRRLAGKLATYLLIFECVVFTHLNYCYQFFILKRRK